MALTSTLPIYLSDIEDEFNASSLVGAANNAGFPTPVDMTDFLGASNIPNPYLIYNYGAESPVLSGFQYGNFNTDPRELYRYQTGNGVWGDSPVNTVQYASDRIQMIGEPFVSMRYVRLGIGLDLEDWEFGNAAAFRSQYSQIRITWRARRDAEFYSGIAYRNLGYTNNSDRFPSSVLYPHATAIREITTTAWSGNYVDTYTLGTGSARYHYIVLTGYAYTSYRRDIWADIFKIEALA